MSSEFCNITTEKEFMEFQAQKMIEYLSQRRRLGDYRDKNIILIEWIKTYSAAYRLRFNAFIKTINL